jgi:hypothetical protein
MEENNSNAKSAFYMRLQDKSNNYIIRLLQRVVLLLKAREEDLPKHGLSSPYKSGELERAVQAFSHSRADLLALLLLVYTDPFLSMLQAQNILNSTSMTIRAADSIPVEAPKSSRSSLFDGYSPKSNLSKYNGLFGGKKRRTRRRRGTSRRIRRR